MTNTYRQRSEMIRKFKAGKVSKPHPVFSWEWSGGQAFESRVEPRAWFFL